MDYIKVEDLKDGYVYEIDARNSNVGVWHEANGEFVLSRFKFGLNYLFGEIHYDLSDDFGTVKPIREVCKCSLDLDININEKLLLDYLNDQVKKCNLQHPRDVL